MPSINFAGIYAARDSLNRDGTIPDYFRPTLEHRLAIAFRPLARQSRRVEPRPRRQVREHFKHRKAQQIYLGILNEDHDFFIPFLLAVSPKVCESVDMDAFRRQTKEQVRIAFRVSTKTQLEEIATRLEFDQNMSFIKLIAWLFPKGQCNARASVRRG
jgi:hypothetical protein